MPSGRYPREANLADRINAAFTRGQNDRRRKVSLSSCPYADPLKAQHWEKGWQEEMRQERSNRDENPSR